MTYWYIAILIYLSTQTHRPQKWHEYLWISICIEYMVYIYPNVYVLSVIFLANQPAIVSRYLSTRRSTCRLIEWTRGRHWQSVLGIWECMITNFVKFMKKRALKMSVFVMVTCTFAVTYMMSVKRQTGKRVPEMIGNQIWDTLEESQKEVFGQGACFFFLDQELRKHGWCQYPDGIEEGLTGCWTNPAAPSK